MDSTRYQLVQRFRVPRSVRLQWVELALTRARYGYGDGAVAILDGADGASPPASISPLVSTSFYPSYMWSGPGWTTPNDFDSLLVLHPNHDYWLRDDGSRLPFGAHALTGSEGADFTAGVGPFWSRANASDAWTAETGRALSLRADHDTTSLAAVEPPPARGALRLEVSPNPSRGTSVLSWSGASGAVRFEVLDARGRRVASHTGGAAGAGQWTWSMAGAGKPLPAGLCFVRATDEAGHSVVARVVCGEMRRGERARMRENAADPSWWDLPRCSCLSRRPRRACARMPRAARSRPGPRIPRARFPSWTRARTAPWACRLLDRTAVRVPRDVAARAISRWARLYTLAGSTWCSGTGLRCFRIADRGSAKRRARRLACCTSGNRSR